MAKSIRAPTLYASYNATIVFYGQSVFFNNTVNVTATEEPSPVGYTAGGSLIQLYDGATCYIRGNVSFTQNKIQAVSNPDSFESSFYVHGGTAIYVSHGSSLIISGIASFVRNQATASNDTDISGGAIFAISQSRVIFEALSNVTFVENSAMSEGGAVYIHESNLIMYSRALFEGNSAGHDGGAVAIVEGGVLVAAVDHNERNIIVFRNNSSPSSGGAIYSDNSDIELRGVLFESNTAFYGGAINAQSIFNITSVDLRDVWFERNTAKVNGGAIRALSMPINMTGTLHFVKNSAKRGGAIAIGSLSTYGFLSKLQLSQPLVANFTENSASMTGGVIFFDDRVFPSSQSCARFPKKFNCFVEFSSRDIRLNFDNNSAEIAGRLFYGGRLDTCTPVVSGLPAKRSQALNIIANI